MGDPPLERDACTHRLSAKDSWDCSSMNRKTMLLFSWPVRVHKQAHHLPQKSWGNGRAGPYKGNKGKGRGRGWRGRGVSVQCVEIGRPELVGGKASKARAQPPHSHQLRGMWRQRTRASSAAPQPYSFSFSYYSSEQESGFPKASQTNCISAQLWLKQLCKSSERCMGVFVVQWSTGPEKWFV